MSRRLLVLIASVALVSGCGTSAPASPPSSALSGSITVLAAASLTTAFTKIGAVFEKEHPGTVVHFSFAGSATLVAQIQQGALGDVFASADQPNMQRLIEAHLTVGSPSIFARNRLQIVVAAGNPKHIRTLADLSRDGLVVVLCAAVVPCGRYANQALQRAGVAVTPASQEADVKAVVSKVALGEADAGIVYVTDVKAAGPHVLGIDVPDKLNVIAEYPIAVLKDTQDLSLARAFVGYVLAPSHGQQTLVHDGFLRP